MVGGLFAVDPVMCSCFGCLCDFVGLVFCLLLVLFSLLVFGLVLWFDLFWRVVCFVCSISCLRVCCLYVTLCDELFGLF